MFDIRHRVRVQSQRIEVGLALREGFCAGT
jgi:hypothetical protein